MFIARTAEILADENIRCRGVENVDPGKQPWLLIDLDVAGFLSDAGWRVVGGYGSEADAIAAAPAGESVTPLPVCSVPIAASSAVLERTGAAAD
jgi:hypothetical protein